MSPAQLLFMISSFFRGDLRFQKHGVSPLPVNLLRNILVGNEGELGEFRG